MNILVLFQTRNELITWAKQRILSPDERLYRADQRIYMGESSRIEMHSVSEPEWINRIRGTRFDVVDRGRVTLTAHQVAILTALTR